MKNIKLPVKLNITTLCKYSVLRLALLIAIFVLSPQLLFADSADKSASEKSSKTIVATVNGSPIFRGQLEKRIRESTRNVKGFSRPKSDQPQITDAGLNAALNEAIAAELFYQGGKKLDLPDAAAKITQEATRIKASLTDEQQKNFSDEDINEYVQRRFYIRKYMAANDLIDPKVSEEEVRAYYEKTKQGYVRKVPAVRVRHILIKNKKGASVDEQKERRKKIDQARQLLLDGKDFSDVAREYSEDVNANSGGELGYIEPGFMPPEFESEAFSLEPRVISKVVETKYGHHVLEVLDIRPKGSIPPYGSLRAFFEKYLSGELKVKKVPAHVQVIRKNADIKIFAVDG